jgi:hypothetical protein
MSETIKDINPTQGTEPLFYAPPCITLGGVVLPLRRLFLKDVKVVGKFVGSIFRAIGKKIPTDAKSVDWVAMVLELILEGDDHTYTVINRALFELLAEMTEQKFEDIYKPDALPLESFLDVFGAITEHQDVLAFFTKSGKLVMKLAATQTR